LKISIIRKSFERSGSNIQEITHAFEINELATLRELVEKTLGYRTLESHRWKYDEHLEIRVAKDLREDEHKSDLNK